MSWRSGGARRAAAGMAALASTALAGSAAGQAPGIPVLQNAFANPGLAVAANFGTGGGQSFFGAAAGWGLGSGRLMLSGAAGAQRGNDATRGAYGARASLNVWTSKGGALGVAGFAGAGGAPRTRDAAGVTTNAAALNVPVGLSVGYRRSIGDTRGISVYASPLYRWTRAEANDVSTTSGSVAGAVGVDLAVTQSIGITVGGEFGKASGSTTSSTFGFALSFVPRR